MPFFIQHAMSADAKTLPFTPIEATKQECRITTYQDAYFVSESFDEAKEMIRYLISPWVFKLMKRKAVKGTGHVLVNVKDQCSHLVFPNICICVNSGSIISHLSCKKIMKEKHPCCTTLCALKLVGCFSEKVPLPQKLLYFRGSRFSRCFHTTNSSPSIAR